MNLGRRRARPCKGHLLAGDRPTAPRVLAGTSDGRLIALNAKTGKLVSGFGNEGTVDLRAGVTEKFPTAPYHMGRKGKRTIPTGPPWMCACGTCTGAERYRDRAGACSRNHRWRRRNFERDSRRVVVENKLANGDLMMMIIARFRRIYGATCLALPRVGA